jgi:hypothetical protein
MLKKLGIPMVALAGLLTFATPKPADARVRFGVTVGVPPPYAYCSPYSPYCGPYAYPYVYGGWGWHHGHWRYRR